MLKLTEKILITKIIIQLNTQIKLTKDGQMIVSIIICLTSFKPPTNEKSILFSLNSFTLCKDKGTVLSYALVNTALVKFVLHPSKIKIKIFNNFN